MTRVELMETLKRCGVEVEGLPNTMLRVPGWKPNPMTEAQAMQVVNELAKTHCLGCGRPYPDE